VSATITGENFDNPSLRLDCIHPGTAGANTFSVNITTIGSYTATSIVTTWPFVSPLTAGDFCVVVVINRDGSDAKYSGIVYKGSSYNLASFKFAKPMSVSRRGAGLALARPTEATRYLYAAGGDKTGGRDYNGNVTALDTVEAVPIDRLGTMSTWSVQRNKLPIACTYSDARNIGMFVYLLCGHTGTSPTNKIFRAQVLDPLQTPDLDVDININENSNGTRGLFADGGVFVYRVSATFDTSDASNPDGESLPGDAMSVKLPKINGNTGAFVLTIIWDPIPDASGYRVYRTVIGQNRSTQVGLLAQTSGSCTTLRCTYTDSGLGPNPDVSVLPYLPGSLGKWHEVSQLTTARAWGAIGASKQPGTSTTTWYLYAFGGIATANGDAALASYEHATVTIVKADKKTRESQTLSTWAVAAGTLSTGRYNIMSTTMDPTVAPSLDLSAGSFYIHIGPGVTNGGDISDHIDVGQVSADGTLALFDTFRGSRGSINTGSRYGPCMCAF